MAGPIRRKAPREHRGKCGRRTRQPRDPLTGCLWDVPPASACHESPHHPAQTLAACSPAKRPPPSKMMSRDEAANRQCLHCGDTERKKHGGPGESAKTDARARGRLPRGAATLPAPRHHCQAASQTPPRQHLRATTPLRTRRTQGAGPPRRWAPALPARVGGVRIRRCQCPPASSPWWRCWS